jgi:hypothetical protein
MSGLAFGESGRLRLLHDRYSEPLETAAALVIGLKRAGISLPPVMLDPCAGEGGLCRAFMDLEPSMRVFGSDLYPGAGVYGSRAALDATNVAHLKMAVRVLGAQGVVSNPPYDRYVNPKIVQASLALLREHKIRVLILMQKASHGLDSAVGYQETTDPLYAFTIACTWRTRLFKPRPGDKNPKYSHVWHVWRELGRDRPDAYPIFPISLAEARAALTQGPRADQRSHRAVG